MDKHTLYIVATPIGHLGDMTQRAVKVLAGVDVIYAEDTRTSHTLLAHYDIRTRCESLHEHNESHRAETIVAALQDGGTAALISDAGTPLISDPGYRLVRACRNAGLNVTPVPGASALTAALSVAGQPTDRFLFAGFPPARAAARKHWLEALVQQPNTLVLYESCHRVADTLSMLVELCGPERCATLARELTKRHETILSGALKSLLEQVQNDANQRRGELVIVLEPPAQESHAPAELDRLLLALLPQMPVRRAATTAARVFDLPAREAYQRALELQRCEP